jgi:hypothetical protein
MTSVERLDSLVVAVRHIVTHDVPGNSVECGVWRGGSMMAIVNVLQTFGAKRRLLLFNTLDGMPPHTTRDGNLVGGVASDPLAVPNRQKSDVWACSALKEVRTNMGSTGCDPALGGYTPPRGSAPSGTTALAFRLHGPARIQATTSLPLKSRKDQILLRPYILKANGTHGRSWDLRE